MQAKVDLPRTRTNAAAAAAVCFPYFVSSNFYWCKFVLCYLCMYVGVGVTQDERGGERKKYEDNWQSNNCLCFKNKWNIQGDTERGKRIKRLEKASVLLLKSTALLSLSTSSLYLYQLLPFIFNNFFPLSLSISSISLYARHFLSYLFAALFCIVKNKIVYRPSLQLF